MRWAHQGLFFECFNMGLYINSAPTAKSGLTDHHTIIKTYFLRILFNSLYFRYLKIYKYWDDVVSQNRCVSLKIPEMTGQGVRFL
jgi:hypothetical protein